MVRRFMSWLVVLTMALSTLPFGAITASADPTNAAEVAELCRQADEEGILDEFGITRGECVNLGKGPASENANNFVAALCGLDALQESVGATNKGQCIQAVRELLEEES